MEVNSLRTLVHELADVEVVTLKDYYMPYIVSSYEGELECVLAYIKQRDLWFFVHSLLRWVTSSTLKFIIKVTLFFS